MDRPLRFVKRLGAIYRVLLETPAGCWLTDCNGPSPPFFEVSLDRYERVPAPNSWMDEHTITPAQEVRLRMIQPMMDCDDCISDKTLRYKMAAEAAQQHQTTTRRILRLYYRYLATGRLTQKRTQQTSKSNQMIERAIRRYYFGAKRLSLPPFRPDCKGAVEKTIDLLQQRYKPMLRGRGVIEDDAQERWATDYRTQAVLDLDDFTRIVIHSILYLNSGRLIDNKTPAERWTELSPRLMAVDSQELHIQTLPRDTAKLTRKGIRVNRMWYAPDDADGLTIGNVYTIAYDPSDLRCIHIILADRICPCHAVEIGQPLSETEWEKAHEAAKRNRGAARAKEKASSIAATKAIRSVIEHADKHREPIRQVDGEEIKQDQIKERGQLSE